MVQIIERAPPQAPPAPPSFGQRAGWFGLHFAGMCAAMCVAAMVLGIPLVAIARALGSDNPIRDIPEVAVLVSATTMSIGMAAFMWYVGHDRRCTVEMCAAMYVEAAVLILLAAAGTIPRVDLFAWFHGLMMVAMLVPMLARAPMYAVPMHPRRHRAGRDRDTAAAEGS